MRKRVDNLLYFTLFAVLLSSFLLPSCKGRSQREFNFTPVEYFSTPPREKGVTDVLELRTEPLEVVRIAVIGLGMRGQGAILGLVI